MTKAVTEWEFRGVDLTTLAYDVRALGAPEQVPARRGDNLVIPHKTGRAWVPKAIDERELALAMYVAGRSPTLGGQMSGSQLWSNLETLKTVFAADGLGTLKAKNAYGTTRIALAEVNTVEFAPTGPDSYALVVEFRLSDPWWYAESATTVGPTVITMNSQNITVINGGTYLSEKAVFTLHGPLTNPKLTIGSVWVQYTGSVGLLESLMLDCGAFTATIGTADVSGNVTHEGALCWLPLPVGTNTLNVASSGNDGAHSTVKTEFYAPYI